MDKHIIGENAGKLWRLLSTDVHRKWTLQEVKDATGFNDLEAASAIGWLALGGRPKERYTEEERELFREIARLKGTLQRLNNYFGGRQYREVFEENQALINELKKILSR